MLTYVVKQVVDDPEAVNVSTSEGRRGTLQLDVRVGDGDMGRVIGKRGRIAQSIRVAIACGSSTCARNGSGARPRSTWPSRSS